MKPKRCARAFGKFCDTDHDDQLSHQEWNVCLSREGLAREFFLFIDSDEYDKKNFLFSNYITLLLYN